MITQGLLPPVDVGHQLVDPGFQIQVASQPCVFLAHLRHGDLDKDDPGEPFGVAVIELLRCVGVGVNGALQCGWGWG